jgi:site-specific recombinase XerD
MYSLRDSGIVDMLHAGMDNLTTMHAAGHHDLRITSVYADHVDTEMIERVREKQVGFSGEESSVDI